MSEPAIHSLDFDAIGTRWVIETAKPIASGVRQRILNRIAEFDRIYSRFRKDSTIAAMAAAPGGGVFRFPDGDASLFQLYDRLHDLTEGAVDPLVGRDLELLGYDAAYTLRPDHLGTARHRPDRPGWTKDVRRIGPTLETTRPLVVDVGAAGKGYLVDKVSALLVDAGHDVFTVDGSGDLRHRGHQRLDVGLQHPGDDALVIGTVVLLNQALCASGISRRAWGDGLHHVIDGRTGLPTSDVVATWVVANDCLTADGLATALFFAEPGRLATKFDFSFARMFADGRAEMSANFDGELFT